MSGASRDREAGRLGLRGGGRAGSPGHGTHVSSHRFAFTSAHSSFRVCSSRNSVRQSEQPRSPMRPRLLVMHCALMSPRQSWIVRSSLLVTLFFDASGRPQMPGSPRSAF